MSDDIDLGEYLERVSEHWVLALLGFILVFGLVLLYTFYSPPVYESKSLVLVTSQDQANFLLGASAPKPADLETQKIIIQSPGVMYPIYQKYGEESFSLSLSTIKNSNVIEISVESNDAQSSAVIANDIARSYQEYSLESRREDAQEIINFVNAQLYDYEMDIQGLDMKIIAMKNLRTMTRENETELQSMERERTAKNKIFDYLLTKREEASLAVSIQGSNVKIVGYADVPDYPLRPNKPLNMALGFILGLGGALGGAMLGPRRYKRSFRRLRYPEGSERYE